LNKSNKLIVITFPLSIFIMMFDFLPVYPNLSISIYAVIQTIIILLMITYLLICGNIKFNLYHITFLLLGFLFITILFIPFSVNVNNSMTEVYRLFRFILLVFIISLFLKKVWVEKYMIYIAVIMSICGYLASLSIITDYFGITNFPLLYLRNSTIRQFGILGECNFAAGKLGIFLPFILFLYQYHNYRKISIKALFFLIGVIVVLMAIFLTGSRMGGVIAIFSLILFSLKERRQLIKLNTFFNILVISIVIVFFISIFGINIIIMNSSKINSIINRYADLDVFIKTKGNLIVDLSLSQRIDCLNAGFKMFKDFPLTGVGLGNYVYKVKDYSSFIFKYSHNTFISILAETGFIGFILFIGLFIQIGKQIYQRYRGSVYNDFYFYLGISFVNLIIMLFFLHDFGNKYFWGMFVPLSMYLKSNKLYIKQEKTNL